jgi:hypothetical protein
MPGKAKRKYDGELMRFNKKIKRPLKLIKEILPQEYDQELIVQKFKYFYPNEWRIMEERYQLYFEKDNFLVKKGKKRRYRPLNAKDYLLNLPQVKGWLSQNGKLRHKDNFDLELQQQRLEKFKTKRIAKIKKFQAKIKKNKKKVQDIEPLYIDAFIAAYHQRGISTEGKVEIVNELIKYNSEKINEFFYKLNDAERNDQIRIMAFKHLQSLGKYVKLRKKFKGKKKYYMTEKSDFNMTPIDLWERISNDNIQNKKVFDVFISHSLINKDIVNKVIKSLNNQNLNAYCDWLSDNDFLKRKLVSDYTKMVLKKRLEQSKSLLLLKSNESLNSEWVSFELDYFKSLEKPIYYIGLDDCKNNRLNSYEKLDYNFDEYYISKLNIKSENN